MKMQLASKSDMNFISEVCLDADQIYKNIMPGAFKKQAKKYNTDGIPDKYDMWVIKDADMNIGFYAEKTMDDNTTYVVGLYILSKYQSFGYGREVISSIINNSSRVILLVHQNADWAIRFYKKVGFEIVGKTKEDMMSFEERMKDFYIPYTFMMCKIIK